MSDAAASPSTGARLAENARRVHPLHWKLLAAFLLLGVAGAGAYVYAAATHHPVHRLHADGGNREHVISVPGGSSGFVGGGPAVSPDTSTNPSADNTDDLTTPSDTWTGWTGQHGAGIGLGFAGGFILGFIFRAFLKMMTLVAIIIAGGVAALSYFHIINIDFTKAQQVYASNADWINDQLGRIKDVVVAHLPSSSTGTAGFYFGLRRR